MVSIYLDAANMDDLRRYAADPRVAGLTTNPTLMKKAGITDYRSFARAVLSAADGKPVSFEVLADDFQTMARQAREIASWGPNVYVKLPITNTRGESTVPLIDSLGDLNLNITAVMTDEQVDDLWQFLRPHHIVSVFAGRIMDTGQLPNSFSGQQGYKTLWASAREVYHVVMAEEYGYDIITLTPDLIAKLDLRGRDLTEYSLATVRMFHEDGRGIEL
jgi:transaldolase